MNVYIIIISLIINANYYINRIFNYSNLFFLRYVYNYYLIDLFMESNLQFRNFLIISFIITGSLSYYTSKFQNIQTVKEGDIQKRFFHPYIQTLTMFIGEFLCLFIYLFLKNRNPETYQAKKIAAAQQGKKTQINYLLLLVPAACDFLSSTLQYFALNFIPGSIYQMLKGGSLITTALFTYLLLKNKIKRHHIFGCLFALVGITIVGASSLIFNQAKSDYSIEYQLLGYGLMILSLFFNGFFYAFEQKIFRDYYIQPLKMVGFEGMYGIIYCLIVIPILTFIKCPFSQKICVYSDSGNPYLQRPQMFVRQVGNSVILAIMVPLGIISVGALNINGLTITKHINALARSLLNMTKTVLIWLIGIIITVSFGRNNSKYAFEFLDWRIILIQVVGFILLIFGTLLYNQNIKVAFFSQSNQEQRESLMTRSSLPSLTSQTPQTEKE